MNPSYFRIKDNMENAINRLEIWNRQPIKERIETGYDDAVDNALDKNGQWKGACLYVYENTGWTVFEDLTGTYADIEASKWLEFAGKDGFVYAGYNDAIPYGEIIVISDGIILKDFGEDQTDPNFYHNSGEKYHDIKDWTDVAAFIDNDEVVYSDTGILIY